MRQGYVNAGGVFIFTDVLPASFEMDVLASNLYIQSGKSIRNVRSAGSHQWRQAYTQAMVSFGYIVTRCEDESISVCPETSTWQTIKARLLKHVSEARIDDVKHILDGLAQTNPKASEVLSTHALHGLQSDGSDCLPVSKMTNEQRDPEFAEAGSCPPLVTVSLLLSFAAAAPVINLVFLSFATVASQKPPGLSQLLESACPVGQLELSIVSAELDELSYDRFRPAIVQQLGSRLEEQLVRL